MKIIPSVLAGKTVLVVDDEEDLRHALAYEFKRRACVTLEAGCGEDALREFRGTPIDIVVSDVRMPKGTGVDLLEGIRKLNPKIPLIFLVTGFADITETEARAKGANGLVGKPIDRKALISLAEELIEPKAVAG